MQFIDKSPIGKCLALAFVAFLLGGVQVSAAEAVGDEPLFIASGDFTTPAAPDAHVLTFFAEFAPGAHIPKHSHGAASQVLFVSGDAELTKEDGTVLSVHAGDVVNEDKDEIHSGVVTSSEPLRLIWTIVLPDGVELETAHE